jgi:hypothetical protein
MGPNPLKKPPPSEEEILEALKAGEPEEPCLAYAMDQIPPWATMSGDSYRMWLRNKEIQAASRYTGLKEDKFREFLDRLLTRDIGELVGQVQKVKREAKLTEEKSELLSVVIKDGRTIIPPNTDPVSAPEVSLPLLPPE